MSGGTAILEAKNLLVRRGGVEVLSVPEFSLAERESVAIIGPNGAGKSTMLLSLATLLQPSAGELLFRGSPVKVSSGDTPYRRKIAMVFQEPLLFDTTVFDNVASGLKIRGVPTAEIRQRVGESLERFRIGNLADRSARRLSGGEVRRTSLARAFATRPEVVLLDEPFTALDPPTRHALMLDLSQVLRESGSAAVFATHDQMEALRLADRMLVMQGGRVVQCGTTTEVTANPVNEFAASFVGMENVFAGAVVSAGNGMLVVDMAARQVEIVGSGTAGERVVLCVHPEHVVVTTVDPHHRTSARNVFPGSVSRIVTLGAINKVYLDCGFPLVAALTSHSMVELGLAVGSPVFASFKATSIHLFRQG